MVKTLVIRLNPARRLQSIDGYAVLVVPESVEGKALDEFLEDVTSYVYECSYPGVVVDLSGLDMIDARIISSVENFMDVLRVLGYPCAVSGILPECAAVMAEMGFRFRTDVKTRWQAEDAVKRLVADTRDRFEL